MRERGVRQDRRFGRELALGAAAHQHRLQAVLVVQRVTHLHPAIGKPVLGRLAGADHHGHDGAVELRHELALPGALFVVERTKPPLRGPVRHAECVEKLEVLILHVLPNVRRNAVRGEQPVRVARACLVEAQLHGRAGERRDEAGLEVHLQPQHQVELALRPAPHAPRETPATRASDRRARCRPPAGARAPAWPGRAAAPR
jgi:hypothetical protein